MQEIYFKKYVYTLNQEETIGLNPAKELQALKGIGEILAHRIVEYREKKGPFKHIKDNITIGEHEGEMDHHKDRDKHKH